MKYVKVHFIALAHSFIELNCQIILSSIIDFTGPQLNSSKNTFQQNIQT